MTQTVFTNDMVAHVWAQQTQPHGRSGNGQFYFDGGTLYSYGSHFPVAMFVQNHRGQECALFNSDSYSITTSRHQSRARSAYSGLSFSAPCAVLGPIARMGADLAGQQIKRGSKASKDIRAHYQAVTDSAVKKAARARSNLQWHLENAQGAASEGDALSAFFALGWRIKIEAPEAFAAAIAADRVRARKLSEQREREANAALPDWRACRRDFLPHGRGRAKVYLRLRPDGEEIETSMGARFPAEHARRALPIIAAVRDRGEEWRPNGRSVHLGHFAINCIAPNGDVTAGCHHVTWREIETVARSLGWL
jgi:hypothetical protein